MTNNPETLSQDIDFSLSAQQARRTTLNAAICRASTPHWGADGRWVTESMVPGVRERCWHCHALLEGGAADVALANLILETSVPDDNDFMAYCAAILLRNYEGKLSPKAAGNLNHALEMNVEHVYQHLYRYTENCATLNAFALLFSAARFGEPRFAERALEWLHYYHQLIERSGATVEFFSPCYLGVTFAGLSPLSLLIDHPEAQGLARAISDRCWQSLAAVWHPGLRSVAAPSGRSYLVDSTAGLSLIRGTVWVALGDRACPSPWDFGLFSDPPGKGFHQLDVPYNYGAMAWMAASVYEVPEDAAVLFYDKSYPFAMQASVDLPGYRYNEPADPAVDVDALGGWRSGDRAFVPATMSHPGGEAAIRTWLAEDYGVGSCTRLLFGQTDFAFAVWRRHGQASEPANLHTLFTRYVINDAFAQKLGKEQYDCVLPEQGRGGALANGPLLLTWYNADEQVTAGIEKLRTCAVLPELYAPVDEVYIGDQPQTNLQGASKAEEWVFIRDGQMYLGFHPLALTNLGRTHAVEVTRAGAFRAVSFMNYEGPAREFYHAELRQTRGGFLTCLGTAAEWGGDFARFRQSCRAAEISDTVYQSQRRIRCAWNGREIELLWDMQSEELFFVKIDGTLTENAVLEYGPVDR
ncbi:MAG: hypothetical protein ACYC7E_07965 [Armatimonadota bacterium]